MSRTRLGIFQLRDEIVAVILQYRRDHGISTIRDVANAVGLSPINTFKHLRTLRVAGRITWKDGLPRTLIVTEAL